MENDYHPRTFDRLLVVELLLRVEVLPCWLNFSSFFGNFFLVVVEKRGEMRMGKSWFSISLFLQLSLLLSSFDLSFLFSIYNVNDIFSP